MCRWGDENTVEPVVLEGDSGIGKTNYSAAQGHANIKVFQICSAHTCERVS